MDNAKPLSQTIADQLAEEIVAGQIEPGTRMDEQSIADRFGVSRTPVRDALRLLASTRLVQYFPRRGFSSIKVDATELDALFEAYGELEATCAKLCALRAGLTERKRIEQVHQEAKRMAQADDTKRYAQLNEELHN